MIVGIGGTLRRNSSSEAALRLALDAAAQRGCETVCLTGSDIDLPAFEPSPASEHSRERARLADIFRRADGVIVASPGYHGAVSGMIKNALDYVEDLVSDERVYFADLPVGCIGVARGQQSAVEVVRGIRSIAHALRAFPTPYGASVVVSDANYQDGSYIDPDVVTSIRLVGEQVADYSERVASCRSQKIA